MGLHEGNDPAIRFPTALLSDALDRLGRPGSALGIRPLADGQYMMGPAFTVRYVSVGHPAGTVGDYIDDVLAGSVVVLDNQGGPIARSGRHSHRRGPQPGCRRHGHRRRQSGCAEGASLGYPIYSRGRFMRTGKDRVEMSGLQCPVNLGDVQVRPGDLVVGDSDGVVVVGAELVDEVFAIASDVAAKEERILEDALSGTPLRDARRRHGYHTLQRSTAGDTTGE